MPVVATLTAIALMRGNGGDAGPFFDPAQLRERLIDGLEGVDGTGLERGLAIADQIEGELERYREGVDSGLDTYIDMFETPDSEVSDLQEQLESLDIERTRVLNSIITHRTQLKDVLDQGAWDKVFD